MKLLLKLLDTMGVSGNEEAVRDLISKKIRPYVDKIYADKSGNLIAIKKGKKPRVMLAAHMDEVGLMVKKIEEDGKIKCAAIGGIKAKSVIGRGVYINTSKGPLHGIIKKRKHKKAIIKNLIVKTKLSKKSLLEKGVETGAYVSFKSESKIVYKNTIQGRALDDRIGCYILIELAKRLKKMKNEIYFAFTIQEEMGLFGALTSAFEIDPDWAIAVDVTDAADMENPKKCLGYGPVITIKDEEFIADKCINNCLRKIAKKKKIPLQFNVSDSGTTDAAYISSTRKGVPTAVVGTAVKDTHTTGETANIKDIENAIKLLHELMKKPPNVCLV